MYLVCFKLNVLILTFNTHAHLTLIFTVVRMHTLTHPSNSFILPIYSLAFFWFLNSIWFLIWFYLRLYSTPKNMWCTEKITASGEKLWILSRCEYNKSWVIRRLAFTAKLYSCIWTTNIWLFFCAQFFDFLEQLFDNNSILTIYLKT